MGQLVSTFLPPWARPYWHSIIENPLNLALFGVCVPLGVFLLWPPESSSPLSMPSVKEARSLMPTAQYSTLPAEHAKSIEWIRYTPRTLALHDGTQGEHSQILLAIDGHVFDGRVGATFTDLMDRMAILLDAMHPAVWRSSRLLLVCTSSLTLRRPYAD